MTALCSTLKLCILRVHFSTSCLHDNVHVHCLLVTHLHGSMPRCESHRKKYLLALIFDVSGLNLGYMSLKLCSAYIVTTIYTGSTVYCYMDYNKLY